MANITWKNQDQMEAEKKQQETLQAHEEKRAAAEKQIMRLVAEQYLLSEELTAEQKDSFVAMFPLWLPDQELKTGEKVVYNGTVYETIQAHTTQATWQPDLVPALFNVFHQNETTDPGSGEPVEVIPEWVQPTGGHNAYKKGDKVSFGGTVYESTLDGNTWSPSAYPAGWQEVRQP